MKASVVIAALNEAPTIAEVVTAAKTAVGVREVIVVSDGSRDGTGPTAKAAGADLVVELPSNIGKAGAVMAGVGRATGDVIVLLDGDLIGLRSDHVERLLRPVAAGGADMSVGVFSEDLLQVVLPSLCGQRAVRRTLLVRHPELQGVGFGLERTLAVIARRERWRVHTMELDGISHRRKVQKYGLVRGYRAKLRAVEDIIVRDSRIRRRLSRLTAATALVVLFMVYGISGLFIKQTSAGHLDTMPAPTASDRILLIAAHNDDEILGAGGYLAAAVQAGSDVTVVILTNGDGNKFSAAVLGRHIRPRPDDYIREGRIRQQESVTALERLGIPRSRIIFMGFPDRGLSQLLTPHWPKAAPYTSPFTKASAPPYSDVFRPASRYTGTDLLGNLTAVIEQVRPTIMLVHAVQDEHPDHQAAHTFVTLALQRITEQNPGIQPLRYAFLVHARDFPRPLRYAPDALLTPPPRIRDAVQWTSFPLPPTLVKMKRDALHAYRSQYESPYLRLLLSSFIRRNELFIEEPTPEAP